MILLMPSNLDFSGYKENFEYFFNDLRKADEKRSFLDNLTDENLRLALNYITNEFITLEYKSKEILALAKNCSISETDIVSWQKEFYISVCDEFYAGEITSYFFDLSDNKSFEFILSLYDDNNLVDLYLYLTSRTPKNPKSEEIAEYENRQKLYELYLTNKGE